MIITSIKRIDNLYEVEFDNVKINVDENTLIKFNLYKGKDFLNPISDLIESVKLELEYKKAREYLKKPRTEKEVRKILECHQDEIINKLKDQYLINDEMYSISYKNKCENKRIGHLNIIKDLRLLGVKDEIINKLSFERDLENIEYIISHESLNKPTKAIKEKLKMKLLQKGFSLDDILSKLDLIEVNDDELIKEDIAKALRKYKNLSKTELKIKITRYLLQKGYSYELINFSLNIWF